MGAGECQICNVNEATVHLTQFVDGEVRKLHLCKECAAKSGINVDESMSIADLLLGAAGGGAAQDDGKEPDVSCPQCHMRRSDFRKTSRLGCPHCYAAFASDLEEVLDSFQKSRIHKGKTPARLAQRTAWTNAVRALEGRLAAAVAAEDFEEAARLRDQLRDASAAAPEQTA